MEVCRWWARKMSSTPRFESSEVDWPRWRRVRHERRGAVRPRFKSSILSVKTTIRGVHRGVHRTRIKGITDTSDLWFQAKFTEPRE